MTRKVFIYLPLALVLIFVDSALPQLRPARARDLGIPFEGTPGHFNAITDVKGVTVGFTTLISGNGKLVVGRGPVRTGVTAILPRGMKAKDPVMSGFFSQNGNGEMTGIHWVKESGFLEGPIMITNTHSVGVVRDAVIAWQLKHGGTLYPWSLPVVAETWDGFLNDADGFHVKPADTWHALDTAESGPVAEGNVGGGTAMQCFGFKGGTGTSSRVLTADEGGYTVGVLVQCNTGSRKDLRIAGVPVGREVKLPGLQAEAKDPEQRDMGSIIIVIATDAPLIPTQMDRLARRATLALGRLGSYSGDGSGDLFVSFTTANSGAVIPAGGIAHVQMLPNGRINPLFLATVDATEEAIVNALVAAKTMTGVDGHTSLALPHDQVREILKKFYHREESTPKN
ncbi:MAG: S58 family peptidase [Acidobacteria bacterium]|nr:MAG: S58 family peptidase [Acidobacteriota bacterium]